MQGQMRLLAAVLLAVCFAPAALAEDGQPAAPKAPMRAAIFVQNRAGDELQGKLDTLNDVVGTRLAQLGFAVIDKDIVVARAHKSRGRDAARLLAALGESEQAVPPLEDAVSGASALRLAQMIHADYLILAAVTSVGHETRRFKGEGTTYGTDSEATTVTLRISLKILEGATGGALWGDTVTVAERQGSVRNLEIESDELMNRLLDAAALKLADEVAAKVEDIRAAASAMPLGVQFSVTANVEGATVELDGSVLGSTPGVFIASPGLHQMRVSKEYLNTWDRTVNIYHGQVMNVTLELSEEGTARFKDMEQFNAQMARVKQDLELEGKERETQINISKEQSDAQIGIAKEQSEAQIGVAKEQSEAEAYNKKKVAEGMAEHLKKMPAEPPVHPAAPAASPASGSAQPPQADQAAAPVTVPQPEGSAQSLTDGAPQPASSDPDETALPAEVLPEAAPQATLPAVETTDPQELPR